MLIFGRHALAGTALGLLMFLAAAHGQAPPQAPGGFPACSTWTRCSGSGQSSRSSTRRRTDASRTPSARPRVSGWPNSLRPGWRAVIGRFAGPGGPGGPGGAPPGMPPFGGRGFAPGSPGQRLSPDAVRTYRDEPFYDTSVLRTLFLQFENADWEKELADFYNTDVDVPAVLTVDGREYRDVGVRFRGMSSFAFVPEGSKRSLNVSIDFADDDQRVLGYRTLNLLNANSDPTFVRGVALQPHRAAVRAGCPDQLRARGDQRRKLGGLPQRRAVQFGFRPRPVQGQGRRALEGAGQSDRPRRHGVSRREHRRLPRHLRHQVARHRAVVAPADPDVQGAQRDARRPP